MPKCPLEVRASAADNAKGADYFVQNKKKLRADLLKYGAIWFRGFDLMKSVKGHRIMYESLGLDPCLDPLHSSGLRKFASERDALYEEVSSCDRLQVHLNCHDALQIYLTQIWGLGQQTIAPRSLHRIAL